jgi:hypothetical protein
MPTDTIRDLILDGYEITISCKAYPCMNRTKADLVALARRYGLDWDWFSNRWPYRCSRCGSREIGCNCCRKRSPHRDLRLTG